MTNVCLVQYLPFDLNIGIEAICSCTGNKYPALLGDHLSKTEMGEEYGKDFMLKMITSGPFLDYVLNLFVI